MSCLLSTLGLPKRCAWVCFQLLDHWRNATSFKHVIVTAIYEKEDKKKIMTMWHICSFCSSNFAKIFLDDVCSKCLWGPMSCLLSAPLFLAAASRDSSMQVQTHLVLTMPCFMRMLCVFLLSSPGLSQMPQEPAHSPCKCSLCVQRC